MNCLTICQPYAHLIVTSQGELPPGYTTKRVENRTWETGYRGPLLIHAGKSEKWLNPGDVIAMPTMSYGALVGVADLVGCVAKRDAQVKGRRAYPLIATFYPWLESHEHTEGPFCWILSDVIRFNDPIDYRGRQGLFNVDDAIVKEAIRDGQRVSYRSV